MSNLSCLCLAVLCGWLAMARISSGDRILELVVVCKDTATMLKMQMASRVAAVNAIAWRAWRAEGLTGAGAAVSCRPNSTFLSSKPGMCPTWPLTAGAGVGGAMRTAIRMAVPVRHTRDD